MILELNTRASRSYRVKRLAEKLGVPRPAALGVVILFWSWAFVEAPDGDLSEWTRDEIAHGAEWDGDPELFASAMIDAEFIAVETTSDPEGDNWYVGDWRMDGRRALSRVVDVGE